MDQFRRRLESDFGLIPVTAAELEFYYSGDLDAFKKSVCASVLKFEKERGKNQYEIAFAPADPQKTADELVHWDTAQCVQI